MSCPHHKKESCEKESRFPPVNEDKYDFVMEEITETKTDYPYPSMTISKRRVYTKKGYCPKPSDFGA